MNADIPFGFLSYAWVVVFTFFLIIIDIIVTNINSRIYDKYYTIELLPWNRYIYKNMSENIAFIISVLINISIYIVFLVLPISIAYTMMYLGIMIYRTSNSIMRLIQYWKMGGFK